MISIRSLTVSRGLTVLAAGALMISTLGANKGTITRLTLDPNAAVVDTFEAMDNGQISVRMSVPNAYEARVFFTNKTDKTLTVAVPKAVVGIHVLAQFPQQGFFGNLQGNNQNGGGANGNGGNGMAQSVGGNMGVGMNQFPNPTPQMNNNFPGNNFFSIPPERTVRVEMKSVCLNYGRPDPHAGLTYRLAKVETISTDPILKQLLEDYSPRINRDAQQAAAWHLANGLSWEQLTALTTQPLPGVPVPIFDGSQIESARKLVEQSKKNAANQPKPAEKPVVTASARD